MFKRLLLITTLLPLLAQADDLPSIEVNGQRDSEWASYRHAYKTTAFFSAFTRTRPLIQAQMQIRPLTPEASLDGLYPLDELRAACEQLIDAQRASGYRLRLIGKRCVGVKFSYPAGAGAAPLEVRAPDGALLPVTLADGHPFEDNSMGIYNIALLRFADLPPQAKVTTLAPPLAIGTAYE